MAASKALTGFTSGNQDTGAIALARIPKPVSAPAVAAEHDNFTCPEDIRGAG